MAQAISVSHFNSTVIDLLNDLSNAVPSFTDLTVVSTLANGMYKLDPNNTTILETFYPYVVEHRQLIDKREEEAILSILRGLLPSQYATTADYIWGELTEENRNAVWAYIELMCKQARKIKGDDKQDNANPAVTKKRSKGVDNDSELFVLYNNVWKEFLTQIQKHDKTRKETWQECLDSLDSLTERVQLHEQFKTLLASCNLKAKTPTDMMTLILPKDESAMKKEVTQDCKTIGKRSFPLHKSLTFNDVLHVVKTSPKAPELPTYWHYIKVLTIVLSECPPELADLLSSMTSGLSSIMAPHVQQSGLEAAEATHSDLDSNPES